MDTKEELQKKIAESSYSEFSEKLSNYLRIQQPLIYLTCKEEKRFTIFLNDFSILGGYNTYTWNCDEGLCRLLDEYFEYLPDKNLKDSIEILEYIEKYSKSLMNKLEMIQQMKKQGIRGILYVLFDGFRFINNPIFERKLKNISNLNSMVSVIITGPRTGYSTLDNLMPFLETPMPNKKEYELLINEIITGVENNMPYFRKEVDINKDTLLEILEGLTIIEAERIFSYSLVENRKLDLDTIRKMRYEI